MKRIFAFVLVGIFLLSMAYAARLPPPPPPVPGDFGSGSSSEPSGGAISPPTMAGESSGDLSPSVAASGTSSFVDARLAVIEHRLTVLEQQEPSLWVLLSLALNVITLGVVVYLLFSRQKAQTYGVVQGMQGQRMQEGYALPKAAQNT